MNCKKIVLSLALCLLCSPGAFANDYLDELTAHVRSVMDKHKPDVKGKIFIRLDKKGNLIKSHMLIESMGSDDKDDLKELLNACKPFKAPPKAYQSTCCFKMTIVSNKHSQSSYIEYLVKVPKVLK
ncbi:MAG: hypothetical protein SFY67_19500 [Candidatus Melainabacteria bacterium]|nr:hypothetical protein [Candidatus Melainabacteria bacterium]